jgi:carbonic anhydrase
MNTKKITLFFALIIASQFTYAAPTTGAPWGYQGDIGPQNWGKLDTDYQQCSLGKAQSPINISQTQVSKANSLFIHYPKSNAEYNDGRALQIDFPATAPEFIKVADKQYRLIQFHIHMPGENYINNKQFPLEIHFVNQSATGDLAVLGVMYKVGKYNAALQQFLDQLPSKQEVTQHKKLTVIADALLPSDKRYYTFNGSLTTPPCSEGVTWFVFAEPVAASKTQLQQLKNLLVIDNARPIQPLNGRAIGKVI